MEVQDVQTKKKLHCLGINSNLILRWKQELEAEGSNAFPGNGNRSPMEEELYSLRAENKRLLMERDILNKATAFYAKEGS
jgi:transposase